MVVTPWGDSEALRERMLPPGPGNTAPAVAENQQQRLFGAMVSSVAERGYESTRVSDLVEISGVSLRSFYDLFPDKRACFQATVEALMSATIGAVLGAPGKRDWDEDSRRRLGIVAALMEAQPAAGRMCLIEAYVAGPGSARLIEQAAMRVEDLVRERLAATSRWAGLPPEMATVGVAAILEIIRGRLLRNQTRLLSETAEEVATLLLSFQAPSRPLRSAARPPEVRPEGQEASDHAERALRGFEALLAEQTFAETTMDQVAKRARMSVRTLYANFAGREELMLAAIDSAGALVVASALPAFRRAAAPPEGIRAALGALFGLLASRPNLANLLLRSAYEGGAPALVRRREALWPLELLLMRTAPAQLSVSRKVVSEALLSGVLGLARRRLDETGPGGLTGLTQICTYIVLAPLLGVEKATAAAEGKSYRRSHPGTDESLRLAAVVPVSDQLLFALSHGPVSVAEMATETGRSPAQVVAALDRLEEEALAEFTITAGEDGERLYENRWPLMTTPRWEGLPQEEREQISAEIGWLIRKEAEDAAAAGTFDARPERFLVRLPIHVDELGWQELHDSLNGSLEECIQIQQRARERLEKSGRAGDGFSTRVILASFEMPSAGPGDE
jgi:AcrR family transcriptional regulator